MSYDISPRDPVTRDELVASVQTMRAALRAALRRASGPVPDWAGAAKELDGVNELSCELWQGCIRESWRAEERGETS